MSIIHSVRNHSPRFMSPEMSCVAFLYIMVLIWPVRDLVLSICGLKIHFLKPQPATERIQSPCLLVHLGLSVYPQKKKSAPPRSSCHVRFPRSCTSASVGSGNNSARASRDMWHESTRGNYVDRFPGSILEPAKSEIWTNLVGQVWLMT